MRLSEPILPIRFYNNIYDQRRFNVHCRQSDCAFELVYSANQLPTFQFKRNSKLSLPTNFYLRNICNDLLFNNYKMIPEGADVFNPSSLYGSFPLNDIVSLDPMTGPVYGDRPMVNVDCGKMVSVPLTEDCDLNAYTYLLVPLGFNDPINFQFKIIVDTFYASNAFVINLKLDGVVVGSIDSAGTFIFDLTNPDGNANLEIEFLYYECGDYFSISYMQGTADWFSGPVTNDVQLDQDDLIVLPNNDGKDFVVFCGNNVSNAPDGQYYYVVCSGSDRYFSEVFTIKRAKALESYYKLTWWNECDINNAVLYKESTLSGCQFKNTLFLDAGLFKPEYDTKDEGEENGNGDVNVTFQRWQKNLSFDSMTPEHITDALSAVFLHEFAYVLRPLNFFQDVLDNEYRILKIVSDIEQVDSDCYQKTTMKLLLEDRYTDTECCTDSNVINCTPCTYMACAVGECDGCDYYLSFGLNVDDPPVGLYSCADDSIVSVRPDDIICFNGAYYKLAYSGGVYTFAKVMPRIDSVTLGMLFYNVYGSVLPWTWASVEYNLDGGGWVALDSIQGDADGDFLYWLPIYLTAGATSFKIRFKMETLNCDYGYSDEWVII